MTHSVYTGHRQVPAGLPCLTSFVSLFGALMVSLSACRPYEEHTPHVTESERTESEHPNQRLLSDVNAAKTWFHARKTRPIWARQLTQAEQVQTLEGVEEVPAGQMLCRGEAGDIWPQSPERLEEKYQATGETDDQGWQKYVPAPDNQGVMAAEVPHSFQVQAKWGELRGKSGDYLVKNYEDRDSPYPDDVWIVDHSLFHATYEQVEP